MKLLTRLYNNLLDFKIGYKISYLSSGKPSSFKKSLTLDLVFIIFASLLSKAFFTCSKSTILSSMAVLTYLDILRL